MTRPLCFVLMPFGKKPKPDVAGAMIDFDAVYTDLIAPAVKEADLEPLRADEELAGGIIHKSMFEGLIYCDFAVADLTTANANVFYELGIRHAVRPWSTVLLFAEGGRLPFDLTPLRGLPYQLSSDGIPMNIATAKAALAHRLREAKQATIDSPIFQLVKGFPEIDPANTDVFREQVQYATQVKALLSEARRADVTAIREVERDLGPIGTVESALVLDLLRSYRDVEAWEEMINLIDNKMSRPLASTISVQEQLAFALNRVGKDQRAERILLNVLGTGPHSETYGILGRIYKDRWEMEVRHGATSLARGWLDKAIDAYLKGFEADWRDPYPGVNALTLMELKEPPDSRRSQLLPVVAYAAERRIKTRRPNYWDYATRLELAVLRRKERQTQSALDHTLAAVRAPWEPATTARNLRLIREAWERRGKATAWVKPIEQELEAKANTQSSV